MKNQPKPNEEKTEKPSSQDSSPDEKEVLQLENIIRSGAVITRRGHHTVHTVSIIGQIEGHYQLGEGQKSTKYEHVLPLLAAVEGDPDIHGLLILLNNAGGDVEAGLAIAELIASMSKPTASLVLGGSHSIGVPLAVAARRSFIAPSAAMTVHPVRLTGLVIGAPQTFYYFERVQERIVRFVTGNSHISREDLTRLMLRTDELAADVGSILYGEEAVQLGLIDQLGGLTDALNWLYQTIEEKKTP